MRANLLRSGQLPHFSLSELIQVNMFLEKQADGEGRGVKAANIQLLVDE